MAELIARARPLVDVVWDAEAAGKPLDTPERQAGLEKRLKERIAAIADRSVQQQYFNAIRERLWTTFRPARGGRRRAATTPPMRSSGLVSTARPAEVLLATLVNHPSLAHDHCEALAGLALGSLEFDRILKEILYFTARAELDSAALKSHLMHTGLAAPLAGITRPDLYQLWAFAGPEAEIAAAEIGLRHLLDGFQERGLEAEVGAAQRELAAADSEENEARLNSLQQQLHHTGLRGTLPDDDDLGQAHG
jgi:DNA primase